MFFFFLHFPPSSSHSVLTPTPRIQQRSAHHDAEQGEDSGLRLSGEEKTLLAVPLTNSGDFMYSPGVQKKLRAYETAKYFVSEGSNGKREFVAYESEDDDEVNRPVM
jgi:hypothetical protein